MQSKTFVPTLLIPSLERDEFITVANISESEAREYLEAFAEIVNSKRKIGTAPVGSSTTDNLEVLGGGNLDLASKVIDGTITSLVNDLTMSKIPRARGRRAVYLDVENDIIGVGTTVIYNKNWAMHGVSDDGLVSTVLDFVDGN